MKHTILRVMTLTSILLFAVTANAGRRPSSTPPTLSTDCPCQPGDGVGFYGSGYKAGTNVALEIVGNSSYTITTAVDGSGNINVNYGSLLAFASGDYTVSAYTASGKRQFLASTSFLVEP